MFQELPGQLGPSRSGPSTRASMTLLNIFFGPFFMTPSGQSIRTTTLAEVEEGKVRVEKTKSTDAVKHRGSLFMPNFAVIFVDKSEPALVQSVTSSVANNLDLTLLAEWPFAVGWAESKSGAQLTRVSMS